MSSQLSENITKFFVLLFIAQCQTSGQDVLCDTNNCPNNERCLRRDGPGNLTYVCECVQEQAGDGTMGHDCFTSRYAIHDTFRGCYGKSCERGSFSSPNYPMNYNTRDNILLALFIPHAESILFDFWSPFCIEEGKDELYVGTGLEVSLEDIEDITNLRENLYHFDGTEVPYNFTLRTDTAFIYFASDKSTVCSGFNITWDATVDYIAPVISYCPEDMELTVNKEPTRVNWIEPTTHGPDDDVIRATSSYPEGKMFTKGSTTVTYIFADIFENTNTCEFTVNITIDDIAPIFHDCPYNMFYNVTYPNTSMYVHWIEPTVTDNTAAVKDINIKRTQSPGDLFENGTHQVQYTATDPYGNQEYCAFIIEIDIEGTDANPTTSITIEIVPLVIIGALFTLISCVCCLGRSIKKGLASSDTSKSNRQNQSSGDSTGHIGTRSNSAKIASFDKAALVLNDDSHNFSNGSGYTSGSSGYATESKPMESINEVVGTHL